MDVKKRLRGKNHRQTKLGKLLNEKGYSLKDFATMVYDKTGYLIHLQNLSTLCSGSRKLVRIDMAQRFADTLGVDIKDIV